MEMPKWRKEGATHDSKTWRLISQAQWSLCHGLGLHGCFWKGLTNLYNGVTHDGHTSMTVEVYLKFLSANLIGEPKASREIKAILDWPCHQTLTLKRHTPQHNSWKKPQYNPKKHAAVGWGQCFAGFCKQDLYSVRVRGKLDLPQVVDVS